MRWKAPRQWILVVALYDGIIRFLYAAGAVETRRPKGRRAAVKRALDIIIHLQARLRMDVGGRPAQALSEFYASIFAQILQASQSASRQKFEHAIDCVRNVRDAWREVAKRPGSESGAAAGASKSREPIGFDGASSVGMLAVTTAPATVSSSSSCCFW
jgi:flagellar protein FliS